MVLFSELDAEVDEEFGFGSWDERTVVDLEGASVEFFFAEDVGERFAGCASG